MTLAQGFIIEYLQLLSEVNFSTNHMTFQIVLCCGVVGYCVIWESNNCLHHALLRNRNIVHTLLVTFQWHSWMSFFTQSIKRTTLEHQQHKKMTGAYKPHTLGLESKTWFLKFIQFCYFQTKFRTWEPKMLLTPLVQKHLQAFSDCL